MSGHHARCAGSGISGAADFGAGEDGVNRRISRGRSLLGRLSSHGDSGILGRENVGLDGDGADGILGGLCQRKAKECEKEDELLKEHGGNDD